MGKSYRYSEDDDSNNRKERRKRDERVTRGRIVTKEEFHLQGEFLDSYFGNRKVNSR